MKSMNLYREKYTLNEKNTPFIRKKYTLGETSTVHLYCFILITAVDINYKKKITDLCLH